MKKVLKLSGIGLFALIILAFLLPVFFKGKIVRIVKEEINKGIAAKVDFKDVNLSLFRHFPKLSIGLEDISITGLNEFSKDTLLSASTIDASVNIMSLFGGDEMKVYGVYLESPRIHALVNKKGQANWEITKEDSLAVTGEPQAFQVKLEKYVIKNGYLYYNDESSNMSAEITGLNHEGRGDFTQNLFTLSTKTKATTANFAYENIPYLINAQAGIDADFEIDNNSGKYSFKNAAIEVNDLKLVADGFMQLVNDSTYNMDIKFDAPSNDFKNILSVVPAIYKSDFDKLKTSGTAALKGFVKGIYSTTQLPAYDINLDIKDGFFQYPDLPQPVKNIQVAAHFYNSDGLMDNTVVDITKGHLEMGTEPFDFKMLFKNPETKKYIDAVIKGKLELSNVSKFIKLDAGTKLAGLIMADAFAKGNLSAIETQKGSFSAGGFLDIRNLYYASKDVPQPIQNGNFKIEIENNGGIADATFINIVSGHIEVGKDPFDFSLKVSRPVTDVNFSGIAKGRFTLDNIKQFITLEPGTTVKGSMEVDVAFGGSKADVDNKNYERINTTGTVNVSNIHYASKDYPDGIQVQSAQLKFSPQNAALNNFNARFLGTSFSANGVLANMMAYAFRNEELKGTLNVSADKINLNDWMGTDTATSSTAISAEPFLVPANMNITVNAKADAVQYDKVTYTNVNGALQLKEETVRLQNVKTEALDGTIAFDGSYSTRQNKTKPDISLNYDVKNVNIQKAFLAFNTVQKLMPVAKFLSGKLSSQFSMTGKLNGDMFPDISSLTGKGNFLLLQGVLSKFQPFEKIANTLNVNELKEVNLKDIKSHFEFANGKMLVKPFNLSVKDINMQVGGMHGFDQSIDYIIGMKLPRKYLGAAGNSLINNLAAQANSRGVPVTLSDVVDLNIKMGGSINDPVIKTDLKDAAGDVSNQMKQQATAFVEQKTEAAKQTLKDSVAVVKQQVVENVKTQVVNQLLGNKDSANQGNSLQDTKEKATGTLKNTLGGFFKKKKAATDSTKKDNP
ncbi:MAG TPA: AsmA-like C-terminal region-containing protein [Flavisolibacter sp.]|nr:AsmA-like C-terminal region-containing protein [Flavisolibacter sp.]